MATLTGKTVAQQIVFPTARPANFCSLFDVQLSLGGPFVLPSTPKSGARTPGSWHSGYTPSNRSGKSLDSFINDYYDRVHISVRSFDFGNLSSIATRQFNVWNAWRTPINVTNVEYVGEEGWSILNYFLIGGSMAALESRLFTLTMLPDGPAVINGGVAVSFSSGDSIVLGVVGRRIVLFPFKPNWKTPLNEILEWDTDVIKSWNGTEQRRSLRIAPRRSFEYNFIAKGALARKLDALFWLRMHKTFAMPVWTDGTVLSGPVAAGVTVIPCLTQYTGFRSNDIGVLITNEDTFEVFEVQSFTSNQIVAKNQIVGNWPAGTKVFPLVLVQQESRTPLTRHTDNTISGRVSFLASPAGNPINITSASAATTYDGLEVITIQPDWGDPIDNSYERDMLVADADVGIVVYYEQETSTRIVRPFRWLLKNKTQIAAFRSFLLRMQGQLKTCWIPSWHDDLTIVGATGPTEAFIDIATQEYAEAAAQGLDLNRDRLMIQFKDGTILYRRVISATKNSTYTRLGVDSNIGRQLNPQDIYKVRFMLKCRFATDKIVIPWYTDSIARPQISFTTTKA